MRHLPYQLVQDFPINSMIMIFFQDLWHFIANEVASLAADSALWSLSRFELLSSGSAAREMAVRFMALFRSVDCFIQSHYKQIHGFLPSGNDVYLGTLSISNPSKNGRLYQTTSLWESVFANKNQASWQLTLLDDTAKWHLDNLGVPCSGLRSLSDLADPGRVRGPGVPAPRGVLGRGTTGSSVTSRSKRRAKDSVVALLCLL